MVHNQYLQYCTHYTCIANCFQIIPFRKTLTRSSIAIQLTIIFNCLLVSQVNNTHDSLNRYWTKSSLDRECACEYL